MDLLLDHVRDAVLVGEVVLWKPMKCLRVVLFLLCAFFGSLIGTRAIELPWPVAGFGLAYVDNSGTNVAVLTDGVGGVVGVYGGGSGGFQP